jgi:hypothetical protein
VNGDVRDFSAGSRLTFTNKKHTILSADGVVVESDTSISLEVQGNFIRIDSSGVTIVGKTVKINSGGAADTWTADLPEVPKEALPADTTQHGRNYKYRVTPLAGEGVDPLNRLQSPADDSKDTQTSWIEIELVDDLGRPVANEEYVVSEPGGREHKGRLSAKGLARVAVREPGACQISFPKLDAAVWERDGGAA